MRLVSRVLGLGLVVLAAEGGAARAEAPPDPRARFSATFRYAGDAREEAARRAAIDRGISTLFFAIRPIARSRLSAGTRIDPWVSFSFADGKIKVKLPPAPDAVSPEAGGAVDYVDDNGEKSRLSQRLSPTKLTQLYATDDGRRTNEWALSPDGTTLTLYVNVSSPKLSAPVVYTLTYRKMP